MSKAFNLVGASNLLQKMVGLICHPTIKGLNMLNIKGSEATQQPFAVVLFALWIGRLVRRPNHLKGVLDASR